ncbi:hypothetical protein B566_EDAN006005 [Ephemera danica]|nr:hypothetical protein B566_EDAN006005 [Ephemera danica]
MDILDEVLEKEAKKNERYKTTDVEKNLELEIDLGNLLAIDTNDLDPSGKSREDWLRDLARDNTQLLLNSVWNLPTERVEGEVMARLPAGTTVLPREKRCPKPKPLTKWQKYAQEKGIKNKKKTNKWVPRFGYRRADAEKQRDWVVEVPQNADPMEDQFAKKAEARKEKVAKNEYQRLRNLAAAKKIKVPKEGLPPVDKPNANQLGMAANIARASTASLGRFQPRLPQEKASSSAEIAKELVAKKKKPNHILMNAAAERTAQLAIADGLLNKRPILDIEKAVNCQINAEQNERSEEKKKNPKSKGGRKKQGGMARGKKGGRITKSKHAGKKAKAGGRKRR